MPFQVPTLGELRRQARDDVEANLKASGRVPNSNVRAIIEAEAGLTEEVVLYLSQLAKELLPDTAEDYLERHAEIWLKSGRKPATFAGGVIRITGANGVAVPPLTRLRGPNGVEYQTTAPATIGGPVDVAIEALDEGSIGNLDAGTSLSFVAPQAGLDGVASVVSLTGGTDAEDPDQLRGRVLERIQNPPHGGNASDWAQWSKEVPGVTRAWVSPNEGGVGTVTVRVMLDDLRAEAGGLPTADDLAAVEAHVDAVRPVTVAERWVLAPIPYALTIKIRSLVDETPATKAAIERELREMLNGKTYRDKAGIVRTIPGRAAPGQTIFRSWVSEAISAAVGEDHHDLEFENAIMPSRGHLAVLGAINYA